MKRLRSTRFSQLLAHVHHFHHCFWSEFLINVIHEVPTHNDIGQHALGVNNYEPNIQLYSKMEGGTFGLSVLPKNA